MDSWWWALPWCFDIEINDILIGWEGFYEPLKSNTFTNTYKIFPGQIMQSYTHDWIMSWFPISVLGWSQITGPQILLYREVGTSCQVTQLVLSIHQYWGVRLVGDWPSEYIIGGAAWSWGEEDDILILKGVL